MVSHQEWMKKRFGGYSSKVNPQTLYEDDLPGLTPTDLDWSVENSLGLNDLYDESDVLKYKDYQLILYLENDKHVVTGSGGGFTTVGDAIITPVTMIEEDLEDKSFAVKILNYSTLEMIQQRVRKDYVRWHKPGFSHHSFDSRKDIFGDPYTAFLLPTDNKSSDFSWYLRHL